MQILPKHEYNSFKNLNKATYIELFFDLVFVFCINRTMQVMVSGHVTIVSWYTFYTFSFTTVLMLQIWFNTTILMNRFGTGGPLDVLFIIVNTLLVIIMAQGISVAWKYYMVYNVAWMLITINTVVHWLIRYRMSENPPKALKRLTVRTVCIMSAQIVIILAGTLSDSFWGQVLALIAVIVGFFNWTGRDKRYMNRAHYHHLSERCSLIITASFGLTIVSIGTFTNMESHLLSGIFYVLILLLMFLIYAIELERALNYRKIGNGLWYMVVTAFQTYMIANMTVAFNLMIAGKDLWIMDSSFYFNASVAVFLLSSFLYLPFNRKGRIPLSRWAAIRAVLCLATIPFSVTLVDWAATIVVPERIAEAAPHLMENLSLNTATAIGLALVFAIFVLDWRNYGYAPRGVLGAFFNKRSKQLGGEQGTLPAAASTREE